MSSSVKETQRKYRFPVYQPCSVSSVPAPSVSMGVYSVNLVILEGPDTDTQRDISVTVITEETFDVRSTQSKWCRAFAYANQVSQVENMLKRSRVDLNMEMRIVVCFVVAAATAAAAAAAAAVVVVVVVV